MAEFQTFTAVIHKRYGGCGVNFKRPWLQGIFCHIIKIFPFGLFTPVLSIFTIVHQTVKVEKEIKCYLYIFAHDILEYFSYVVNKDIILQRKA